MIDKYLSRLSDSQKRIVATIFINVLLGTIGLFFFPLDKAMWIMSVPWIAFALSHIGFIPFAGFVIYYWLYSELMVRIYLIEMVGVQPNIYTQAIFWLFFLNAFLFTIRSTASLSTNMPINDTDTTS